MKISYNWLNDYVDLSDINPQDASNMLTMKSAEVEYGEQIGLHFENVIAARVIKVVPHPDSERLKLATVFDGKNEQTVVCGAPNVAEGQIVAFAPVDTMLPGNFLIKPVKIRGIESCGMICAEDELGLGTDHEGIMVLENSLLPGTPVSKIFGKSDYIIEIENKTINHRPDMWGHYGVARELRAIFEKPWKKELKYNGIKTDKKNEIFQINIKTDKCLHYLGLKMENIKITSSPEWLRRRLENVGVRSINNIVDIANFVMLETGHPLHTFDRRDITGNIIVIRDAINNEKFLTLDGIERVLIPDDSVIADESKSLAIAGVMGGLNSEIKHDTSEIFIESALFHPASVRKTANRLDLRTDSSSRFEKSLWVENCYLAIGRFVELTKEIIPDSIVASELSFADNSKNYGFRGNIEIKTEKIRSLLGISNQDISDEKIVSILQHLDFNVENNAGSLNIVVPEHRRSKDVSIPEDIIEEIGRLYGYNNILASSPMFSMERGSQNTDLQKSNNIRDLMVKCFGSNEVMNYIFCGKNEINAINFSKENLVETCDTKENPYLRFTMANGLLNNIFENLKFYKDFSLFEFGKIFYGISEKNRFAVASTGNNADFSFMKKIIVSISKELRLPPLRFERINSDFMLGNQILHPNKSATILCGKTEIGILGSFHPALLKKYDINHNSAYMEIELEKLFSLPQKNIKFIQPLKYPSTSFDVSVIVPDKTEVENLLNIIKKSVDSKIFIESKVVDHFSGDPIPKGFLSISFRIVLNAKERTLTGEEMKNVQQKLFNDFRKNGFKISGD